MHLILPPLLTYLPNPDLLERRLTGSTPAVDLRPWKGATEVAEEAITVGAMALLASSTGEDAARSSSGLRP
jgi:hypothetical protein